jgi:hypothetical protein
MISLAVTWGGSDILLCSFRTETCCDNTIQPKIRVVCCIITGRSLCSYGCFGETSWPDLGSHYYLTTLKRVAVPINIQRFGVMTLRNYTPMYIHSAMSQKSWIFMETAVRAYKSRTFHQFQHIAQTIFLTRWLRLWICYGKNVNHFTTKVRVDKVKILLGLIQAFLCLYT